jgi:hypothetical protein
MSGRKPAFYFLGVVCALSMFSGAVHGQTCTNPVTGTVTCTGGAGSHVTDTNNLNTYPPPTVAAQTGFGTTIDVTGGGAAVKTVSITLHGYTSVFNTSGSNNYDGSAEMGLMLVSPNNHNLEVLRCPGDVSGGNPIGETNLTITLQDGGSTIQNCETATSAWTSGTWAPASYPNSVENEPNYASAGAPALQHSAATNGTSTMNSVNGVFTGDTINGAWKLYLVSDAYFETDVQFSSWDITITYTAASTPSTTVLSPSSSTAFTSSPNNSVTLTATVSGTGGPPTGTVQFQNGASTISGCGAQALSGGQATCVTSFTSEGLQSLSATYSGNGTFEGSSGTAAVYTYNHSTNPGGNTYCNSGTISGNNSAATLPYPSVVDVTGLSGESVDTVSVTLQSFSTNDPNGLHMLLVSPDGNHTLDFWGEAGAAPAGTGSYTLEDGAGSIPNGAISPGTYSPTANFTTDNFALGTPIGAPAPQPPGSFSLAGPAGTKTFETSMLGATATGNWLLYVDNEGTTQTPITNVSLGGWCVDITPSSGFATTVNLSSIPTTYATKGQSVTFTATVTSSGHGTVNEGTVTFTENDVPLAGAPNSGVAGVSGGSATIATSGLAEGDHTITATYHDSAGTYNDNIGTESMRVDAATPTPTLNGSTWTYCNTAGITIPAGTIFTNDTGPAAPNPSNIFVTNLPGTISTATLTINGFSVSFPGELESLVAGANGKSLDFFSLNDGTNVAAFDQTVTFADSGATIPANGPVGTDVKPASRGTTSYTASPFYTLPAIEYSATQGSFTFSSVYGGSNPNGTWSLYFDQTEHHTGDGASGWCVNLTDNNVSGEVSESHIGPAPSNNFVQGGTGQLTTAITNEGAGPTGDPDGNHALTVTDTLNSALSYASFGGADWTCSANAQVVTCVNHDPIAQGNSYPTLTINVNVSASATSPVSNDVTVSGGGMTLTTGSDSINIDPSPLLSVNKSHPGTFTQGSTAEWDITVNNTAANSDTTGTTTVLDALPTGYTLASYTGTGWTCTGTSTVSCTSSQVVAGGSSFNTIALTVNIPTTSPTSVTNTAEAYGGGDNTHTMAGNAATGTDLNVPVAQVPASVTITAGGTQSAGINTAFGTALTVVVKDAAGVTIPTYNPVTFTAPGSGPSGTFSNSTNTINGTTNGSGVVSETFTANGAAGGPYSVTAVAGSASASPAFMLTNTTTPSLSVSKSHTGTFTQGQTAEWDITVNNTVTNTSTSGTTSVSDVLPSGYTLSSYTASGWSCSGTSTVSCTSSQVVAGGSSFNKIQLFVNVPAASPTSVSNTALAWGGGDLTHTNSGNAASGTDANVPVVQVPASVTITAGGTQSATINTAFGTALTVVVKDAGGVVIPSYTPVTFTAPATGASGVFSNSTNTINGTTNGSGVVSETFTANGTAGGPYSVTATAGSASASPAFMLTNTTVASDALILSVSPGGSGSAGANPTNSTGLTAGNYTPGAVVTLTASPGVGYVFSNWSGSVDISNTTANPTTITMNASTESVTANFVLASTNVTSSVKVTSTGLVYNRVTKQGSETVTITNTTGSTIAGPVQLVISGLPGTVTPVGNTGTFSGNPYWTATAGSLTSGASAQVTITFSYAIGTSFSTTASVYSGSLP